jgi:two-component system, OmpR family, response regulator
LTAERLLVVEDDPDISAPLAEFLSGKGYLMQVAGSIEAAEDLLRLDGTDLILLDVMLPGGSGLDFCRRLRATAGGPRIIMLTALSESTDKIVGLEVGADDYVTKPFDLRELLARVRAVLRRPVASDAAGSRTLAPALRFCGFTFHPHRRLLRSPGGLRIPLTGAEADLLLVLCEHPRQVLSRRELIDLTRGEGFAIATRSVDLLVSRLRRKLAGNHSQGDIIQTSRADGYAFQSDVAID